MRAKIWVVLALIFLAQIKIAQAAAGKCLNYQPEIVAVSGKLHRETFPGRPNFESVNNGDEPETGFYMTLTSPICTVTNKFDEGVKSVLEIQLILNQQQYDELRPKLGKVILLKGKLSAAISGHHHAALLLEVLH
jgi:hypothetical protein